MTELFIQFSQNLILEVFSTTKLNSSILSNSVSHKYIQIKKMDLALKVDMS